MLTLLTTASALPAADWDLVSFFGNAKSFGQTAGGAFISLMGLIGLIIFVVFLCVKLWGNQQGNSKSWVMIIVGLIISGALLTGGITLITKVASGGQTTIEELGGGFIVPASSTPWQG